MPSRASVLWMLTALLIAAYPVPNFIYWPEILKSGVLPVDGDSIGIPMFGSLLVTLVVSPIVIGMAWMCYRRYNPSTRFLVYRLDRPLRSAVATGIFGVSAAIICFAALADAVRAMPWYEYLWPAYMLFISAWLLTLRASFIQQHTVQEAEAEPLQ
ncbi:MULTISPECIES: hypothetical protein [unclassified Sphingomonas]|uniref:hypothetical protein n=1 Tax=unclassified Sphingomonas TaxID=196159 RepID=UPI0012E15FFB|nr:MULTISPECIES: hypothetical protein [unclassified Sphingomonas]